MKVRLESVGCRVNAGEVQELALELRAAGHRVVGHGERADVCVLNSCAVTAVAAHTSRQALRRLRRSNPGAVLVATGCLAELVPGGRDGLGVDLLVGNRDKDRLPRILAALAPAAHPPRRDLHPDSLPMARSAGSRTRAFVKVQDGCDSSCTYCVVTVARGASRSVPAAQVVRRLRALHAAGCMEAVLCGVHLGAWGRDLDEPAGLEGLVRRLLAETSLPRLRLSSLEPWDLEPGFFDLLADPRLLPHLHLPLQSGCDATLRRMGRRTDRAAYASLLATARAAVPGLAISTDVMVGFPGESGDEFEQSLDFVESMGFSRLHVFRYSRRAGTAAARMDGQVPAPVARRRSRRMIEVGRRLEEAFQACFVGRTVRVLWETSETRPGGRRWSGLSDHYVRVVAEAPPELELGNRVTAARIRVANGGRLVGEIPGLP